MDRVGVVVGVVVDARETDEHRNGGAQLGEELTSTRAEALVDGWKAPGSNELFRQRAVRFRNRGVGNRLEESHRASRDVTVVSSPLGDLDAIAERFERRLAENHLARLGRVLDGGELVDETAARTSRS